MRARAAGGRAGGRVWVAGARNAPHVRGGGGARRDARALPRARADTVLDAGEAPDSAGLKLVCDPKSLLYLFGMEVRRAAAAAAAAAGRVVGVGAPAPWRSRSRRGASLWARLSRASPFYPPLQLHYSAALIGGGFNFKNPNATETVRAMAPLTGRACPLAAARPLALQRAPAPLTPWRPAPSPRAVRLRHLVQRVSGRRLRPQMPALPALFAPPPCEM